MSYDHARMTFGLISWLKTRYPDLNYEVPVWYPTSNQPDFREWIVTNGLGGFASGTIAGTHRRRYHSLLTSALNPPRDRHIILSRVDERVTIDGEDYELSTNIWGSGVLSPRGFRLIESFTTLPSPTWVFSIGKHHLVKQLSLSALKNELTVGYFFIPDANPPATASITIHFLTAFRSFHSQMQGSSDFHYPQFVSPRGSVVRLSESDRRLCLSWSDGEYEPMRQWWWDYAWAEETARGERDSEDLLLVGRLTAPLARDHAVEFGASTDRPVESLSLSQSVNANLKRQRRMLETASMGSSTKASMLLTAADQFIVHNNADRQESYVIRGYPWFSDYGRDTLVSVPGLFLSTNRHKEARQVIQGLSQHLQNGLLPTRFLESSGQPEYIEADITLWWAWALFHYARASRDLDFIKEQLPKLKEAARHFIKGSNRGIFVDLKDGLVICQASDRALTWMDAEVANFPITPRSGKPVEIAALWLNFLDTILYFSEAVDDRDEFSELEDMRDRCKEGMQKFWSADLMHLYDVLPTDKAPDETLRPNQLIAVAMPFRAFPTHQEKAIITSVDAFLHIPKGLRTLSNTDEGYQGKYGCGLAHADQYHRDLSYFQGTACPWLLGMYCESLVNVFGVLPETAAKISLLLQPLIDHLTEEGALGSVSEIFDGDKPHAPRGCFAHAMAVAELLRWQKWCAKVTG